MAKAIVETKTGTKIQIEGTADEVARVVSLYKDTEIIMPKESKKVTKRKTNATPTAISLIRELIAEGALNTPKSLAEINMDLGARGKILPITTLSGLVLQLVQNRELRRLPKDKRWVYVKP